MTGELDELTAAVEENTTVDGSAIVLLKKLADLIEAGQNNPTQLRALAAKLRGDNAALVAAVAANTPAEPEPEPTP